MDDGRDRRLEAGGIVVSGDDATDSGAKRHDSCFGRSFTVSFSPTHIGFA